MIGVRVPLIQQRGHADCVVTATMMILQWASREYDDIAEFTYEELKSIIGVQKTGSRLCDVEKVNREKRLAGHRWKLRLSCGPATSIESIWTEIEEGTPVIAYLDKEIGDAQMRHAVVVTGFSSDKTEMRYNDPIKSEPQTVATSRFLEEWEKVYRYHVKLEISEDFDMTDFLGDE